MKITDFGITHSLNSINQEFTSESSICIDYPYDYMKLESLMNLSETEKE